MLHWRQTFYLSHCWHYLWTLLVFFEWCFFLSISSTTICHTRDSGCTINYFQAGVYLFKVNYRNTRKRCKICSKLTIKTAKRRHWRDLPIVNLEHVIFCWVWYTPPPIPLTFNLYNSISHEDKASLRGFSQILYCKCTGFSFPISESESGKSWTDDFG